ncbi:hypothetical protein O6P43_006450 [Quillaja saponaria]|uniref:Uncharacterized protein n=1 Tax=Quillaja saponaria TaxID=32244 RepID=A0AAD7VI99_QUISA|nr:hypothetical protein O6P43_006450 [Quillaja saponaria]
MWVCLYAMETLIWRDFKLPSSSTSTDNIPVLVVSLLVALFWGLWLPSFVVVSLASLTLAALHSVMTSLLLGAVILGRILRMAITNIGLCRVFGDKVILRNFNLVVNG